MKKEPFKVFHQSEETNNKKVFFNERFTIRRKARNFCQKRWQKVAGLHIVHPDGKTEPYGK